MNDPNFENLIQQMTSALSDLVNSEQSLEDIQAILEQAMSRFGGQFSPEFTRQVAVQLFNEKRSMPQSGVSFEEPFLTVEIDSETRVGHMVHIDFVLHVPGCQQRNFVPEVVANFDSAILDESTWNSSPRVACEELGRWSFSQEFALREKDRDVCPPGTYGITLEISFSQPVGIKNQRFYRVPFKIGVKDIAADGSRELTIDSADGTLVNLQFSEVKDFDKVRLKAGGDGVINFLHAGTPYAASSPSRHQDRNTFKLPLRPNHDVANRHPFLSQRFGTPTSEACLAFDFEGGRTTIVYAKDRLSIGRNRPPENDIILRWVPMTSENQELSLDISRRHLSLQLEREGLRLEDLNSNMGTTLNGDQLVANVPTSLHPNRHGLTHTIELSESFELRIHLHPFQEIGVFSVERLRRSREAVAGSCQPAIWNRAYYAQLDGVRIDRVTNLREENYLMLFRSILIGPADNPQAAISLPYDDGVDEPARLIAIDAQLYLERLAPPDELTIKVDEQELEMLELVPLQIGQIIRIGSSKCEMKAPTQNLTDHRPQSGQ